MPVLRIPDVVKSGWRRPGLRGFAFNAAGNLVPLAAALVALPVIAHLAGSTRPEFLFTSTDFNSYIDVSVADDAPRRAEGRLAVPTTPGLGLHVDESRLPAPVLSMP